MTEIRTSCFRSFRPSMGTPVVIALRTPKWMPQAEAWPKVRRLMPSWAYFNADDATFEREYVAQLDRYGVESIRQRLEEVARQTGASTLVLLCHESDGNAPSCHRGMFRDWAARHGWTITEAESGKPSLEGEFRERDDAGRQLVVCGRWTYAWQGHPPLEVGEQVWAPFGKEVKEMTVTALGSSFAGSVREVVARKREGL